VRAGHAEFGAHAGTWIPGIRELLTRANQEKWIRNEDFPSLHAMAVERARSSQFARFLQKHGMATEEIVQTMEPKEEEIAAAMLEIHVPQILIDTAPQLRNSLAHGSSRLSPTSLWTLRLTSEAINQMFGSNQSTPGCT
jgi:hypothetical protein